MILRRVIEHVKKQEWTAIAIDFVIVVIGVFVGIQVSNWNIERETNQKAAIFSERLKDDLRMEAWGYEYVIEYTKDVLVNAERVLAAINGEAPLSDEQFLVSAYRATQYITNDRQRATYDELVSTGTIGLIRDQKLRKTAIMVFASVIFDQISNEGRQSEYRELFRRTVDASVQRALLDQCGDLVVAPLDYEHLAHSLDYPCTLNVSAEKIHAAAQALRSREGLVASLQLRFADLETSLGNFQRYNMAMRQNLLELAGREQ